MKEHNIQRLIQASPFWADDYNCILDDLIDFFDETGATLDNMNVDDLIVNSLTYVENGSEWWAEGDEPFILGEDYDGQGFYILQ